MTCVAHGVFCNTWNVFLNEKSTNMKNILITGAAGYIGSHIALLFARNNFKVIGLDFLQHAALSAHPGIILVQGNCTDPKIVDEIFKKHEIHAIIHCASFIEVSESVTNPDSYYQNNISTAQTMLNAARKHGTKIFILSSSCAVYGAPQRLPLDENHPTNPMSPYGKTKRIIEWMMEDFSQAYGLKTVALRFFNAAGSWDEFGLGENHIPESHLIPRLISAALEKRPIEIFGTDYPTPDGTCIRDFISVADIAQAHLLTLRYLEQAGPSNAFNLGSARGYSIKQIISELEYILNTTIATTLRPRRPGDPAILVADASRAKAILGWHATEPIKAILQQALAWHLKMQKAQSF